MPTLKQFEVALRAQGLMAAVALLEKLREKERSTRTISRARRVTGKKMTPELARRVVELHRTTNKTQQEIAFELGVNQGRVNEVLKHGKHLNPEPRDARAPTSKRKAKAEVRSERPQRTDPILNRRREPSQPSLFDDL